MSTPCEKLGYEEGMRFTLVNDDVDGLSAGDTLWLHSDDGSSNPEFRNTEKVNDDTETYYIDLICVARYTEDETLAYNRGLREGDILQMVMDDDNEYAYEGDIITFIKDVLMLQRGMIDTMLATIRCPHPAHACTIHDSETVYCERCEEQLTPDQVIRRLPGDNRIR